jgi:hypothetical protein
MDFRQLTASMICDQALGVLSQQQPPPPAERKRVSLSQWFQPERRRPAPPEANDERIVE